MVLVLNKHHKNDKDFQYEKEPVEGQTWWDRFWDWVWNKYDDMMSTESGRTTMKIIYWLLGAAAVAFFILKVSKMSGSDVEINLGASRVVVQGKGLVYISEQKRLYLKNIHI